MNENYLRLAVYGKGGIGKSTIAANLSAAFAAMGKSVLQVGCDPKHDSTRLLLGGRSVETVLEHLENPVAQVNMLAFRRKLLSPHSAPADVVAAGAGLPEGLQRENVLHEGFGGALCIEAGGPRPGVGCAGRGILTTFELLHRLKINPNDFDVVVYDVLGDVVCGGFGVPMRHEHANAILLVTSEEYMPIYAANNILRGVKSYDRDQRRLVGLFLNRRDNRSSTDLIDRFAARAELPVVADLPRSPTIQAADRLGQTVVEAFGDGAEAAAFHRLARDLVDASATRYGALPATDEELERVVLGRQTVTLPARSAAGASRNGRSRATSGEPRRVALYGKGGIGKSTIAANLSATLAARGLRVLQIGCDPKHDSTRLLLGGATVQTVLEYLRDVAATNRRLDEVVHHSECGVDCIEVGGPEPGLGCAGRGIVSAFTLLEKLGLREQDYDVIVYDVLGDVVCGGFAIPMRMGYAQSIVLVSSEEYMPLYAANNILRGLNGVVGPVPKVLGLFHNVRDNDASFATVDRFSRAVGVPAVSRLDRSQVVQQAEQASQPLAAFAPQSAEAAVFERLADRLMDHSPHYPASPLSDADLEQIVLGKTEAAQPRRCAVEEMPVDCDLTKAAAFTSSAPDLRFGGFEQAPNDPFYYRKKPIRQPIWGCAFRSAAAAAFRLRDAVVVAHAPRSCAYVVRSAVLLEASKAWKRRGQYQPDQMAPNLVSTDMTVSDMIHGGTKRLASTLKRVLADRPPVVFLATACPAAIIGDDVAAAIREAQPTSPETPIIPLRTDGNMTGGGANGFLSAMCDGIFSVLDAAPDGPVDPMSVNIIADWSPGQSRKIHRILADVGIRVNTSFSVDGRLARTSDLRKLSRAPLTLRGATHLGADVMARLLESRFGTRLARYSFPRGYRETELWLRDIGDFFGIHDRVEEYLAPHRAVYEAAIAECRGVLKGKRVIMFAQRGIEDWILDVMVDSGIEVALVGFIGHQEEMVEPTRYLGRLPIEFSFHPGRRREVYDSLQPDAVYAGRQGLPDNAVTLDAAQVDPEDVAFGPEVTLIRRWARLLSMKATEGWRRDFVKQDKRAAISRNPVQKQKEPER